MVRWKTIRKNKHFTDSEEIFTHGKVLLSQKKILSEELFKISKDQRLQHFSKLTRKVVLEKTSKAEGSLEAQQCHKIFPLRILAKINFQYNHYRTRYLQSLHSSPLLETTSGIRKNKKTNEKQFWKQQKIIKQATKVWSPSAQSSKELSSTQCMWNLQSKPIKSNRSHQKFSWWKLLLETQ